MQASLTLIVWIILFFMSVSFRRFLSTESWPEGFTAWPEGSPAGAPLSPRLYSGSTASSLEYLSVAPLPLAGGVSLWHQMKQQRKKPWECARENNDGGTRCVHEGGAPVSVREAVDIHSSIPLADFSHRVYPKLHDPAVDPETVPSTTPNFLASGGASEITWLTNISLYQILPDSPPHPP